MGCSAGFRQRKGDGAVKFKDGEEIYTRVYGDADDRKWVKPKVKAVLLDQTYLV